VWKPGDICTAYDARDDMCVCFLLCVVCIYIWSAYIYVCGLHIYIHTYMCTHIYIGCIYTHTHSLSLSLTHTHTHTHTHIHMVCSHIHIYTHVLSTYIHIYTCMVCAYTYMDFRWHVSRIIKVDVTERTAFVHFNGWSAR
jgi:hypothetical protein